MEPLSLTVLLLLFTTSVLFFLLIIYMHKYTRYNNNNKHLVSANLRPHYNYNNLPPGSFGFPIIGETLHYLLSAFQGHPEDFFFNRVAKYSSPLFKTHLFGQPVVVFTGAEGNKFLFSNTNKLVTIWWPESLKHIFSAISLYDSDYNYSSMGEEASKFRKMISQFMKPDSLKRHISVMDTMAQTHVIDHLINKWQHHEKNDDHMVVNMFDIVELYIFSVGARLLMNLDYRNFTPKFHELFVDIFGGVLSLPINLPGTRFNRAIVGSEYCRKEIVEVLRQRKKEHTIIEQEGNATNYTHDFLSHMLSMSSDKVNNEINGSESINEDFIASIILGMLVAGHDTLVSVCTFIVKYLAEYPRVYDKVYAEQMKIIESKSLGESMNWVDLQKMKYSWNVACEVMRLTPPFEGTFREAINDFTFNGFFIPKGWKLYWSATHSHKNPDNFKDPETFDPTRFEENGPNRYTFVPFGGGPRMCPGNEYARFAILIFMHHLVKRFKFEKLITNEKVSVYPIATLEKGLPVRLYPHFEHSI